MSWERMVLEGYCKAGRRIWQVKQQRENGRKVVCASGGNRGIQRIAAEGNLKRTQARTLASENERHDGAGVHRDEAKETAKERAAAGAQEQPITRVQKETEIVRDLLTYR